MPAIELVKYLESSTEALNEQESINESLDLLEIPAKRMDVATIHLQATLEETLNKLDKHKIDALYVERMSAPGIMRLYGVITRAQIESAYQIT
ncbi:MAG: hypothetical protein KZQ70_13510 [gamma proteobacterium symbiont of Lucinoma myriamae]|nr:hypothetical protein [gamma proteobacterium symbiont of Lucinoma myriamae]MCU7817619.1 hypothetical protein [gamma proteobacterium symbiont of Lucinoma myriamae]MCU7833328.1 hypothetical protein [gamma proteobacterium symbiont of Lucinoma myriamae]